MPLSAAVDFSAPIRAMLARWLEDRLKERLDRVIILWQRFTSWLREGCLGQLPPPKGWGMIEALRASAGGWKGLIDAEELQRNLYADRLINTRPEPKLCNISLIPIGSLTI